MAERGSPNKPPFAGFVSTRLGDRRRDRWWLPPSPDGIAMCHVVDLRATKRRGQRDEGYYDRGGSGKERVPAPRRFEDWGYEILQEADAGAVPAVRLQTVPGVGPLTALAVAAFAPAMASLRRARDFAA